MEFMRLPVQSNYLLNAINQTSYLGIVCFLAQFRSFSIYIINKILPNKQYKVLCDHSIQQSVTGFSEFIPDNAWFTRIHKSTSKEHQPWLSISDVEKEWMVGNEWCGQWSAQYHNTWGKTLIKSTLRKWGQSWDKIWHSRKNMQDLYRNLFNTVKEKFI